MELATWIVRAIELYLAAGALFAVPFVWRGVTRIDSTARTGTLGFRVVIFPGCVLLWPWLCARLASARRASEVAR